MKRSSFSILHYIRESRIKKDGTAEENNFVNTVREEAAANIQKIEQLKGLLS